MGPTWPWNAFRICGTVTAVLVFDQAVFAGRFLAGSFGALHTHRENATYAGIAALITAAAGLLVRLRGGGPIWPAAAALGLFGLIGAQIALGFARLLTIHIPLGVAIITLTVLITGWSWRHPQPVRSKTGSAQPTAGNPEAGRDIAPVMYIAPAESTGWSTDPAGNADTAAAESDVGAARP